MSKKGVDMQVGDFVYRYEDDIVRHVKAYDGFKYRHKVIKERLEPSLHVHRVDSLTPQGFWYTRVSCEKWKPGDLIFGPAKWTANYKKKPKVHTNKRDALLAYVGRKEYQINLLVSKLEALKTSAALAKYKILNGEL